MLSKTKIKFMAFPASSTAVAAPAEVIQKAPEPASTVPMYSRESFLAPYTLNNLLINCSNRYKTNIILD